MDWVSDIEEGLYDPKMDPTTTEPGRTRERWGNPRACYAQPAPLSRKFGTNAAGLGMNLAKWVGGHWRV